MHELIVNDWLDHDYIDRHTEGWPALRERALAVAAGAGRRDLRHRRPTQVRSLARDYGTTAAGGDPPELRHAARARRRQRGAPDRDPAVPGRRLAASRRRPAALELGLVPRRARRRRAAAARPARRAPAAHDQHEHDRRRPAARERRGARRRPPLRSEDRGARRLQQQPGRGRARSRPKVARGLRARGPVHGRARALHDRHRRPRRLRAAGDDPARAPRRAHELRPHLRADQRGGDRAARRGEAEHADLPRAGRAMGFDDPCFADERRGAGADRVPAGGATAASISTTLRARRLGQARRSPRRRSPKAASRRRAASAGSTRPASASPTTCRTTNRRRARPSSRRASRWR